MTLFNHTRFKIQVRCKKLESLEPTSLFVVVPGLTSAYTVFPSKAAVPSADIIVKKNLF